MVRRRSILRRVIDALLVVTIVLAASNAALALEAETSLLSPLFAFGLGLLVLSVVEQGRRILILATTTWYLAASLVAFAAARALSAVGANDGEVAIRKATGWSKDVTVALAILLAARVGGRLRLAVPSLVATFAVLTIPSLVQLVTGTFEHQWWGLGVAIDEDGVSRIGGPLGDPNVLAQWVLMATAVIVVALLGVRAALAREARVLAAVIGAAGAVTVLATRSRAGLIGMTVLGVCLLVVVVPRPRRIPIALAAVALVSLLLAGSSGARRDVERIGEVSAVWGHPIDGTTSSAGYAGTFRAGLRMFADHPVTGVGSGNFELHYREYAPRDGIDTSGKARAAHNLSVEVLAETGLVGALAFALVVVSVVLAIRRARRGKDRPLANGIAIAMVVFAVTSMFKNLSHPQFVLVLAALAGAAADSVWRPIRRVDP